MNRSRIVFVDPADRTELTVEAEGYRNARTGACFPIVRGIPRFVAEDGYAENFGDQWNTFRRTQLDRETGVSVSRERLYKGTEWDPAALHGKAVLEIGCGAGRFTEQLLRDGAEVWAVDRSSAVDACLQNHGRNPRLHLAQADLFHLPFVPGSFDCVLMYGVLQHTPLPRLALETAIDMARKGGWVAIDSYVTGVRNRWTSKYRWRWITRRMPPRVLRRIVTWYVPKWMSVEDWIESHSPEILREVSCWIPCWNYKGIYPLSRAELTEWAVLDTYDALGARYDFPSSRRGLVEWLRSIPDIRFSVKRGGIGLEVSIERV